MNQDQAILEGTEIVKPQVIEYTPVFNMEPLKVEKGDGRIIKESYFPNFKVELLLYEYNKGKDLRYYQKALEYSVLVMEGMVNTHKMYTLSMEEMKSEGVCIAAQALRTFDVTKDGSTSLFSYLSWAFYRGNLTIRLKANKWDRLNKLFDNYEDLNLESDNLQENMIEESCEREYTIKDMINLKFKEIKSNYGSNSDLITIVEALEYSYRETNEIGGRYIVSQIAEKTGLNKKNIKNAMKIVKEEFEVVKECL
jgi:hypothetical protein